MSSAQQLSFQRMGSRINVISIGQERLLKIAVKHVRSMLVEKYPYTIHYNKEWRIKDIVHQLNMDHPDAKYVCYNNKSTLRPDGGILSLIGKRFQPYPILISECKHQGTNKDRQLLGLHKQAKGNAIERLGKNVNGFKVACGDVFPFIAFGDGCDFYEHSSILDRVSCIGSFKPLNTINLSDGSFYFRDSEWSLKEMIDIMFKIADKAVKIIEQRIDIQSREHYDPLDFCRL